MEQIQVTDLALENIRDLRLEYGEASWGLRFGLSGGGCSGYKYVLEFEDVAVEGDLVFEFGDVKVFVNQEHMEKLKNSTIDWKDSLMESGYIDNPKRNALAAVAPA